MKRTLILLSLGSTAQTSLVVQSKDSPVTLLANISGSGTLSATVAIYGTNFPSNSGGMLLTTLSLTNTAPNQGYESVAQWPYYYAILSSPTGTNVDVTVSAGV